MNRQDMLSFLKTHSPEVLIVGAGINGVGTFRDLALQGVDVLLVDQGDFCSGASAASSHMAHGGIRYLENGEFRLVREAVRERNRMIENAPHLVHPLPTTFPIFKLLSGLLNAPLKFLGLLEKPAERGGLVIKIGLIFYDAFTRRQGTVPAHVFEGRRKSLEKFPALNPEIKFTATYYDGSIFSPERYTVELLLDAQAEGDHARALNYVSLAGVQGQAVLLRDEVSGAMIPVRPKLLINAAGPWIDLANRILGLPTHYIGGTKGSHLVLDHPELRRAIGDHEFFFENKDGRIVLLFPLGDKVMVGTSDLPIDDPDSARCTPAEEDYFIEMIGRVFPDLAIRREQIVFRFSGVRPLAYTQARIAGQITRDHHIQADRLGAIPILSLVGGKWTSYRAFSEQVTNQALAILGLPRKADTQELPIGGGADYPWSGYEQLQYLNKLHALTGLPGTRPKVLFDRYGTRAAAIAGFLAGRTDAPLAHYPEMTRGEIVFLVTQEGVVHLDDLLLRRTMLAILGQLTHSLVEELGEICGATLGWSQGERQAEVKRALKILADRHGVRL
ncbi:MAG: glycerol-3-phosphate dehydrogenase/oxidase [Anaerolineales bacterium]|nr:glycerol-3-phosphate dehydrogenase/oxidase [Anaerolineales bacterium]